MEQLPTVKEIDWTNTCRICGNELVEIRGKYPNQEKRKVCATCTTERLEQIFEIANPDYGKAYQQQ